MINATKRNSFNFRMFLYIVTTSLLVLSQGLQAAQPYGYYQTRNIQWGIGPDGLDANKQESMHYAPHTHTAAEPFMSTSYFPVNNVQIKDITEMRFDIYLPEGSTCTGGSPRIVVQVNTEENPDVTHDVIVYPKQQCATNKWTRLEFINPGHSTWTHNLGLVHGDTRMDAHRAVAEAISADYKIRVIRINFDDYGSAPEAWFDNQRINGIELNNRAQDFSANALLVDDSTADLADQDQFLRALPLIGHFQSRNTRWSLIAGPAINGPVNEAMHFDPLNHPEDGNNQFMSASYFPQNRMQLPALKKLNIKYIDEAKCSALSIPEFQVVVNNIEESDPRTLVLRRAKPASAYSAKWTYLQYLNGLWDITSLGGNNQVDKATAHEAIVDELGDEYIITIIRLVYAPVSSQCSAWFDAIEYNDLSVGSRSQDWEPNQDLETHTPDELTTHLVP